MNKKQRKGLIHKVAYKKGRIDDRIMSNMADFSLKRHEQPKHPQYAI